MWPQVDFCSCNNYVTMSSHIKKNQIPKNFAHVGLCAPEMLTKFWDFAAGMDFDTWQILNFLSWMHDFHPSNSIPSYSMEITLFIPI